MSQGAGYRDQINNANALNWLNCQKLNHEDQEEKPANKEVRKQN
jgi:hypothetical protein